MNTYKKMWEYLKEYIHEAYNGENEIETMLEQIEELKQLKELLLQYQNENIEVEIHERKVK